MYNINEYNKSVFEPQFKTTKTYQQLVEKFSNVSFEKFIETDLSLSTPRRNLSSTLVSAVSWYYLAYLDTTKTTYDLGCGDNFFKPYFTNLVGVDYEHTSSRYFFGDEIGFVDQGFYQSHKDTYDAVFSINALHFHPLEELKNICYNFANMLKKNSNGYLALNVKRMTERSELFKDAPTDEIEHFIRKQFKSFPFKILVFDLDLSRLDAYIDGNLRIVFSKD